MTAYSFGRYLGTDRASEGAEAPSGFSDSVVARELATFPIEILLTPLWKRREAIE